MCGCWLQSGPYGRVAVSIRQDCAYHVISSPLYRTCTCDGPVDLETPRQTCEPDGPLLPEPDAPKSMNELYTLAAGAEFVLAGLTLFSLLVFSTEVSKTTRSRSFQRWSHDSLPLCTGEQPQHRQHAWHKPGLCHLYMASPRKCPPSPCTSTLLCHSQGAGMLTIYGVALLVQ